MQVELYAADFLDWNQEAIRNCYEDADVILMNNILFSAEQHHDLKVQKM